MLKLKIILNQMTLQIILLVYSFVLYFRWDKSIISGVDLLRQFLTMDVGG